MRPALAVFCLFTALACDNGVVVLNVAPAVTAVGPVVSEADGLHVFVWLRDHERQPIELGVVLTQNGAASAIVRAGGHGLTGLTSSREETGEPHEFIVDSADFAPALPLVLRVTPVDTEGAAGVVFVTPEFAVQDGLPTP